MTIAIIIHSNSFPFSHMKYSKLDTLICITKYVPTGYVTPTHHAVLGQLQTSHKRLK